MQLTETPTENLTQNPADNDSPQFHAADFSSPLLD